MALRDRVLLAAIAPHSEAVAPFDPAYISVLCRPGRLPLPHFLIPTSLEQGISRSDADPELNCMPGLLVSPSAMSFGTWHVPIPMVMMGLGQQQAERAK